MSNNFTHRQVVVIGPKDVNIEVIQPQFVVLGFANPTANGFRYLDVGSFCYIFRSRLSRHKTGCAIDPRSFDNTRTLVVREMIERLRVMQPATAIDEFAKFKAFIDWMDEQVQSYAFDDANSVKKAYIDYTHHLLFRMKISGTSNKAITRLTASKLQSRARTVVRMATGLSEIDVRAVATHIFKKTNHGHHMNSWLPSADEQARTFATLITFIDEAHRLLVGTGELPAHLISPSGESYYLYSMMGNSEKSRGAKFSLAPMLSVSKSFPTWKETKTHFCLFGDSAELAIQASNYYDYRRRFERNNADPRSYLRHQIGVCAVAAGILAFIAATGCNLSTAQKLEIDTFEIVPSTQGRRLSGTKARAKGKIVHPEFGARFSPVFRKYMELREWLLNGADSPLVFPIVNIKKGGISFIGSTPINSLKRLFANVLPKTTWITPTQWRKNVSYQYVKHSGGDMALTAEKLSNTVQVVEQNYSRPALEDFAAEMAGFFELMHQAAIDRTRTAERIPVRILDEKKPEAATATGSCEKTPEEKPERAHGFTALAPAPACREPESCLFCAFYAIHADEEDIRRLLSLRYLITATENKQPIDDWQRKFGPTIHRIDEVLSTIHEIGACSKETINRVRDEVASGNLDAFWSIHFDTLVMLGAVS